MVVDVNLDGINDWLHVKFLFNLSTDIFYDKMNHS
jgi:hypothetical protein